MTDSNEQHALAMMHDGLGREDINAALGNTYAYAIRWDTGCGLYRGQTRMEHKAWLNA